MTERGAESDCKCRRHRHRWRHCRRVPWIPPQTTAAASRLLPRRPHKTRGSTRLSSRSPNCGHWRGERNVFGRVFFAHHFDGIKKTQPRPPLPLSYKQTTTKNSNWNPSARWPAPRSSALDAARLDSELTSLLAEQAGRALAPVLSPGVAARFHPEMTAALEALVFLRTVAVGAPTPGLALLGLRFVDNRSSSWWRRWLLSTTRGRRTRRVDRGNNGDGGGGGGGESAHVVVQANPLSPRPPPLSVAQRASHGLATVALSYAWDRAARSGVLASLSEASEGSRAHRAATLLRRAETAASAAAFANSVLFLAQRSRYRSLLEAALGAGLEPSDPAAPRSLSFDYLNRQLVWHELSELMLAVLPLFDRRLLARARRAIPGIFAALSSGVAAASSPSASAPGAEGNGGEGAETKEGEKQEEAKSPPPATCGTCGAAPPSTPFAALPCRHAHCYYCLAARCAADPRHECWCGERVAAMVRLR